MRNGCGLKIVFYVEYNWIRKSMLIILWISIVILLNFYKLHDWLEYVDYFHMIIA